MSIDKDKDYGTPESASTELVNLEIDGFKVTVPAGTSVMRAAASIGIDIPKLCATDSIEPFGSCRLCVVQIEGGRGLPASCTTPVFEGMKAVTQNQKLADVRRGVMDGRLPGFDPVMGQSDDLEDAIGDAELRARERDAVVQVEVKHLGEPVFDDESRSILGIREPPDDVLREATGLPVVLAEDPLRCVVMGAGECLERPELLKRVAL